jgi:sugar phosphate isomerase/epimerase
VVARLADLAPHLALVQLGDGRQPRGGEPNRLPLGEGELPLQGIVSALAAADYDGFFELELMGEEIEAADYREILRRSARTFANWTSPAAR